MIASAPLTRQIAILVDGGFFLRRIEALGLVGRNGDPEVVASALRRLVRRHIQMLAGVEEPEAFDRIAAGSVTA